MLPTIFVAEQEDVDLNLIITANTNIGDPAITSVTATCDAQGNIVISIGNPQGANGNTVISITGRYNDNFDKSITYEAANSVVQSVTRFKNIEPGYNFVSEYLAAGGGTTIATYTVTINGTPFTVTQPINNSSYTPGKNLLVQAVAQGKY